MAALERVLRGYMKSVAAYGINQPVSRLLNPSLLFYQFAGCYFAVAALQAYHVGTAGQCTYVYG